MFSENVAMTVVRAMTPTKSLILPVQSTVLSILQSYVTQQKMEQLIDSRLLMFFDSDTNP